MRNLHPALRGVVYAAAAAVGAVIAYVPWMGWGMLNGSEFAVWQIVGSGLTFAAVAFAIGYVGYPVAAIVATPLAYTAAWSYAASDDPSGLFLVGAVMVLGGTVVGAGLAAGLGLWCGPTARGPAQASETSSA